MAKVIYQGKKIEWEGIWKVYKNEYKWLSIFFLSLDIGLDTGGRREVDGLEVDGLGVGGHGGLLEGFGEGRVGVACAGDVFAGGAVSIE